jgi:hypothetical protein
MAKFDLPQRIEAEYQTSMFKLMAAIPIASAIEKRTDTSRTAGLRCIGSMPLNSSGWR